MESFGKILFRTYCENSHFHGFREMLESPDKGGRIFWAVIICVASVFSVLLIYYGAEEYTQGQFTTLVSKETNQDARIRVKLCPADWIDFTKMRGCENGPSSYLMTMYSLTYLRHNVNFTGPMLETLDATFDHEMPYKLLNMHDYSIIILDSVVETITMDDARLLLGEILSEWLKKSSNIASLCPNETFGHDGGFMRKRNAEELEHLLQSNPKCVFASLRHRVQDMVQMWNLQQCTTALEIYQTDNITAFFKFAYSNGALCIQDIFNHLSPEEILQQLFTRLNMMVMLDCSSSAGLGDCYGICFRNSDSAKFRGTVFLAVNDVFLLLKYSFQNESLKVTDLLLAHEANWEFIFISDNSSGARPVARMLSNETYDELVIRKLYAQLTVEHAIIFTFNDTPVFITDCLPLPADDNATRESHDPCFIDRELNKIAQVRHFFRENEDYKKYLQREHLNTSILSMRRYFNASNIETAYVRVVAQLVDSYQQFWTKQESLYLTCLNSNNFSTPFEYLASIMADDSHVTALLSIADGDPIAKYEGEHEYFPTAVPSFDGDITKVFSLHGVCYEFIVNSTIPPPAMQFVNVNQGEQKLNILYYGTKDTGSLSLCAAIYPWLRSGYGGWQSTLMPCANAGRRKDDLTHILLGDASLEMNPDEKALISFRYGLGSIQILHADLSDFTTFEYVNTNSAPCSSDDTIVTSALNLSYTERNCILSCSAYLELNNNTFFCYYGAETTKDTKTPEEMCSIFRKAALMHRRMDPHMVGENFHLTVSPSFSACRKKCSRPCKQQLFRTNMPRPPEGFERGHFREIALTQIMMYLRTPWGMSDEELGNNGIEVLSLGFDTAMTRFEQRWTVSWHAMFGIIGGQIGLVMGASVLSLIQFIYFVYRATNAYRRQDPANGVLSQSFVAMLRAYRAQLRRSAPHIPTDDDDQLRLISVNVL